MDQSKEEGTTVTHDPWRGGGSKPAHLKQPNHGRAGQPGQAGPGRGEGDPARWGCGGLPARASLSAAGSQELPLPGGGLATAQPSARPELGALPRFPRLSCPHGCPGTPTPPSTMQTSARGQAQHSEGSSRPLLSPQGPDLRAAFKRPRRRPLPKKPTSVGGKPQVRRGGAGWGGGLWGLGAPGGQEAAWVSPVYERAGKAEAGLPKRTPAPRLAGPAPVRCGGEAEGAPGRGPGCPAVPAALGRVAQRWRVGGWGVPAATPRPGTGRLVRIRTPTNKTMTQPPPGEPDAGWVRGAPAWKPRP